MFHRNVFLLNSENSTDWSAALLTSGNRRQAFRIPPISEHLEGSNISFEEADGLFLPKPWNPLLKESSAIHGVRSKLPDGSICMPRKAEDSSSKMEIFPLLSPVMESELLKEPWPQLERSSQSKKTPSFWEENFQDLSDWCMDPQKINRFHIPLHIQGQRDYHIGEEITFKNSGVKDNYDNLSNNKSELEEITGVDENWTVDNNNLSTGMSFDGSLPVGQDQFDTITDLSDVWLDVLPTTSGINEEQTIDNMKLISNKNENVPDHSLDLINENIDNWFPIDTTDNNLMCNELTKNIQIDDTTLESYHSASTNYIDDKLEKKHLRDILLTADAESESFDLLSYVFDEGGNILERKNTEEKVKSTTDIEVTSKAENRNSKSKIRRERKTSQARVKAEPYVPPLKINLKSKNLSVKNRRISKQSEQEIENYSDSESDTHTSDYNYKELREKNNKASRKSRINKKVKESEMLKRASDLERDNAVLKMKVEELEKLVISMRTALLQSALKKEI